jgi:hypothetical protein
VRKLLSWLTVVVLVNGLLGTSAGAFPSGGALPPALTLVVPIAGLDGVPDDAVGVAMNVTVTSPAGSGFLTVYPCGEVPPTSNLNYAQDQTVPNFVVSGLSPDGEVCIDTFAVADVIVDLAGYIPGGSPIVMLPQPSRVVDSRQGIGLPGPMPAGQVAEVQVAGSPGVPVDASMILFNATVTSPVTAGFLTVFPCGEPIPPTSTLNFAAGATVPNFVVAKIGTAGRVCLYSTSRTEVLVDVAGYLPAGVTDVVPLAAPARLLDTRTGIGGPPGKITATGRTVQLGGVADIPDTATAVVVNLTATQSNGSGFVSAYPCGSVAPVVSNLNFTAGSDVANMAIVKLGSSGQLCLTSNNDVDVIADVTGYLNSDSSIAALPPVRIYDSRDGVDPPCNIGVGFVATGFDFVDLKTGSIIGHAPGNGATFPRAYVRGDCQHIDIVAYTPGGPAYYQGWTYDKSGTLITSYVLPDSPDSVIFTDQGPLVLDRAYPHPSNSQVVDPITGFVLFSVAEPPMATDGGFRIWEPAGATSDGSLIALQIVNEDRTRMIVSYWTPDGVKLGEWTGPTGGGKVKMSPSGTYLAYPISTGSVSSTAFITTLDGTAVAALPNSPNAAVGTWITDGSMLSCVYGPALEERPTRWDLFSPIKDLVPGSPYKSCVIAAG